MVVIAAPNLPRAWRDGDAGQVGWLLDRPETHPIGMAMSAAAEAGVLTVASSGNAGGNGFVLEGQEPARSASSRPA